MMTVEAMQALISVVESHVNARLPVSQKASAPRIWSCEVQ
jgi:hypothetical protein